MAKATDKHGRVRIYPETERAIRATLPKLKVPTSYPKLVNAAIVKGLEALAK